MHDRRLIELYHHREQDTRLVSPRTAAVYWVWLRATIPHAIFRQEHVCLDDRK